MCTLVDPAVCYNGILGGGMDPDLCNWPATTLKNHVLLHRHLSSHHKPYVTLFLVILIVASSHSSHLYMNAYLLSI